MTCHQYLSLVKKADFGLLTVVIVLFILGLRVVPTVLLLVGTVCAWRMYRCPVCGCSFDPRISLKKMTYCPNCSCNLLREKLRKQ